MINKNDIFSVEENVLYFDIGLRSSSSSSSSSSVSSSSSSSSSTSSSSSSLSSSSKSSSSKSSSSSSVSVSWVSIFNNGKWQPWDEAGKGPGTWDEVNQEWDSHDDGVYEYVALEAIGDWWVGLKDYPKNTSKIRVSHNPEATLSGLILYETSASSWADPYLQWESNVVSGAEITINWSELDLKYIVFRGLFNTGVPFSITNIEFLTGEL